MNSLNSFKIWYFYFLRRVYTNIEKIYNCASDSLIVCVGCCVSSGWLYYSDNLVGVCAIMFLQVFSFVCQKW